MHIETNARRLASLLLLALGVFACGGPAVSTEGDEAEPATPSRDGTMIIQVREPGELCVEYQLAAQSFRPDSFVTMAAYADDGMCYICPKNAYGNGGYEPGRASRVAPEVEGVLMTAIKQMLEVAGE